MSVLNQLLSKYLAVEQLLVTESGGGELNKSMNQSLVLFFLKNWFEWYSRMKRSPVTTGDSSTRPHQAVFPLGQLRLSASNYKVPRKNSWQRNKRGSFVWVSRSLHESWLLCDKYFIYIQCTTHLGSSMYFMLRRSSTDLHCPCKWYVVVVCCLNLQGVFCALWYSCGSYGGSQGPKWN